MQWLNLSFAFTSVPSLDRGVTMHWESVKSFFSSRCSMTLCAFISANTTRTFQVRLWVSFLHLYGHVISPSGGNCSSKDGRKWRDMNKHVFVQEERWTSMEMLYMWWYFVITHFKVHKLFPRTFVTAIVCVWAIHSPTPSFSSSVSVHMTSQSSRRHRLHGSIKCHLITSRKT